MFNYYPLRVYETMSRFPLARNGVFQGPKPRYQSRSRRDDGCSKYKCSRPCFPLPTNLLPLCVRNDPINLSPNLLQIIPQNLCILKFPRRRRLLHKSFQQRLLFQQRL